jgi:hypothetical protein
MEKKDHQKITYVKGGEFQMDHKKAEEKAAQRWFESDDPVEQEKFFDQLRAFGFEELKPNTLVHDDDCYFPISGQCTCDGPVPISELQDVDD